MPGVIYYKPGSIFSSMVRMVVAEKGIKDIEYKEVDLDNMRNLAPDYIKINPKGEVPAYVSNGQTISGSLDISMYLESHYPSPSLLPGETSARSRVTEDLAALHDISYFSITWGVTSAVQAEQLQAQKEALLKRNREEVERQMEIHPELHEQYAIRIKTFDDKAKLILDPVAGQENWAKLRTLLNTFEERLSHGQFLSQENDFSLLDGHATPVLARLVRLGHEKEIQSRPRLWAYWSRIKDRDSFRKVFDRPVSNW
jgi:glutathione S-transferase